MATNAEVGDWLCARCRGPVIVCVEWEGEISVKENAKRERARAYRKEVDAWVRSGNREGR